MSTINNANKSNYLNINSVHANSTNSDRRTWTENKCRSNRNAKPINLNINTLIKKLQNI